MQTCALPILRGKGSKERLVPLGQEDCDWLERYLREARPILLNHRPADVLFPSQRGQPMTRPTFWCPSKDSAQGAGTDKSLWRRTPPPAYNTKHPNHGAGSRV